MSFRYKSIIPIGMQHHGFEECWPRESEQLGRPRGWGAGCYPSPEQMLNSPRRAIRGAVRSLTPASMHPSNLHTGPAIPAPFVPI